MNITQVKSTIWTNCPALALWFVITVTAAPNTAMFTLSGNLVFVFILALV